ncbi:MAG: hypothetical protein JNK76_26060 [Planctomycetales bacterium]|nr:hypothetical protein [Planctomycetales bacterium]MBN8626041.1 hypothetical protein [Planctomycetota bacterium]
MIGESSTPTTPSQELIFDSGPPHLLARIVFAVFAGVPAILAVDTALRNGLAFPLLPRAVDLHGMSPTGVVIVMSFMAASFTCFFFQRIRMYADVPGRELQISFGKFGNGPLARCSLNEAEAVCLRRRIGGDSWTLEIHFADDRSEKLPTPPQSHSHAHELALKIAGMFSLTVVEE